jgi:hypothetical protein
VVGGASLQEQEISAPELGPQEPRRLLQCPELTGLFSRHPGLDGTPAAVRRALSDEERQVS